MKPNYSDKGGYILLLQAEASSIKVGSLGVISFQEGWYTYIGSALGPGGFARVKRHIRVAGARDQTCRWHIDYLLQHKAFTLTQVYCIKSEKPIECQIALFMEGLIIKGFGSSDCNCPGHLFLWRLDPVDRIEKILNLHQLSFRSRSI